MIATLRLEAIGDNYIAMSKMDLSVVLRQVRRVPAEHRLALLTKARRPWVAKLTGLDDRHGFAREFLDGNKDWQDANSTGSRGVYFTYVLRPDNLYEVRELLSWQEERRYFCRVEAGEIIEMQRPEVVAALLRRTAPAGAARRPTPGGMASMQQVINMAARRT